MKTGEGNKGRSLWDLISHVKAFEYNAKNIGNHLKVLRNLECYSVVRVSACTPALGFNSWCQLL